MYKSIIEHKAFVRLQIDLMEVKPMGQDGERYIFTIIDVATRYAFLRTLATRDAIDLCAMLLDVFLDMGVVPEVVQSDNEFCSLAFEELLYALGSTQVFSTALHPQSQGIVERAHRDMRAAMAKLVEEYVRANPRKWPQYVRYLEYKLRHKEILPGITPYRLVHGFSGSTELASSLRSVKEIPQDILATDWLMGIVAECRELENIMFEHWSAQAEERMRKHAERAKAPDSVEGDLVLLS